jgi:hypothetical protein
MYYQGFHVVGVANTTVLDGGLVSTVEEPKRIEAILIDTSVHLGNIIEGWIGNLRVLEVPDYLFDTRELNAATIASRSTTKILRLPVDLEVPVGQIFKIGVRSAGVGETIDGSYEYSLIGK